MATLREVREAVFPAATPVGSPDPGRLDTVVGWIRLLRARVPAFDVLEPGDLVIVPATALSVVAPSAGERADLVSAFVAARLSGLVVVAAPGAASPVMEGQAEPVAGTLGESGAAPGSLSDGPDADLGRASAAAGLPVFRVDGIDPGLLERSLIGFLVNRRGELELQAARLEERLQALALGRADLGALVAEIGGFLGRAVALEGRRGDRLAVHASVDDPSAAAAVARYLAGSAAVALRVPLPAAAERLAPDDQAGPSAGRAVAGSLLLLGDRPATELEQTAASRIAGALALELARDEAIRRARDASRAEPLPPDGPPWVVLVARQVRPGDASSRDSREEDRRELRLLASGRRLALRGSAESLELRAVLAADASDPSALGLADRIAAFLGRTVAVSRPFDESVERPGAEAEARATLEAVEAVAALDAGWAVPPVARADRLAAYRALGALHNIPDGPRIARSLLAPILVGRPSVVRERLATLRAVLDAPGPAEAAASLRVHRNTLAYRIRRIEALSGWRLTDPSLRLPLSMAVRLVQDAQSREPGGGL